MYIYIVVIYVYTLHNKVSNPFAYFYFRAIKPKEKCITRGMSNRDYSLRKGKRRRSRVLKPERLALSVSPSPSRRREDIGPVKRAQRLTDR